MSGPGWAWAALALYVGLLLAFGLRTWMQWRATGMISGEPYRFRCVRA